MSALLLAQSVLFAIVCCCVVWRSVLHMLCCGCALQRSRFVCWWACWLPGPLVRSYTHTAGMAAVMASAVEQACIIHSQHLTAFIAAGVPQNTCCCCEHRLVSYVTSHRLVPRLCTACQLPPACTPLSLHASMSFTPLIE